MISSYLPISVLSRGSKTLERVVYKRLHSLLINNNLLFPRQYGLLSFVTRFQFLYPKMNMYLALFSKPFDTIGHYMLLNILHLYGIRGTPLSWSETYLSDRKQCNNYSIVNSNTLLTPKGLSLEPCYFSYISVIFVTHLTSFHLICWE